MKLANVLLVLAVLSISVVAGCGRGGEVAPTADSDEISRYVAEHPDSDAGTEPEGGD